ncbi:hypothetical protein BASA81_002861 [Batrachochytrium salamandrivorans]|nr:hypothetical protein BASA81_002861 [Batrachochytrium salamandrivorans]
MFVDINSILHMRAHRATSTGDLMIKVLQRLKAVIERGQLRASRQIFFLWMGQLQWPRCFCSDGGKAWQR